MSPKKKSLNFVNEFSLICYYLPLQQGIVLHLKTLILQFRQYIFANLLLSPLGKKYGPSFEQTWIPFTPSSVEIDPAVLEKKTKIWKFNENNDNHNNDDDGQIMIRKAHLSLRLMWAKNETTIISAAKNVYYYRKKYCFHINNDTYVGRVLV